MTFLPSPEIGFKTGARSSGMEAISPSKPPSIGPVDVSVASLHSLHITAREFFVRTRAREVSYLVEALFGSAEITGVSVHWTKRRMVVAVARKDRLHSGTSMILRHFAAALREGCPQGHAPEDVFIVRADLGKTVWMRKPGHAIEWTATHVLPGRIRFHSSTLESNRHLAGVIDSELVSVPGVDSFSVSPLTGSVLVEFDARLTSGRRLIQILRTITERNRIAYEPHRVDYDLPLNSACLPLALSAELLLSPFAPLVGLLVVFANRPTLKMAYQRTIVERKLGCDFLDTIVLAGCLATGNIFAMAVIGWCLSFGRALLKKSKADSEKLLKSAFSKQPRFAWQVVDGQQVEVTVDALRPGDVVAVRAGDMIPVDGEVLTGLGLVDQHTLTGESAPVEKTKDDPVFATTMLISGELHLSVTRAGNETTSAKIGAILAQTASYKISAQSRGEELSEKAVPPTLAVGGFGLAALGLDGGVAVLNSECGTAIRMAAPLGLLSSLTLCAGKGILVKDGQALENMRLADTILFDKTGTLTREVPEVCEIHTAQGFSAEEILSFAASAEQRFSHPIARAICDEAASRGIPPAATDSSDFKIGFGVEVMTRGRKVRVGSPRYMESEGLALPSRIAERLEDCGKRGHTLVLVGCDRHVIGGIELRAAARPEAFQTLQKLRRMGVKDMVVISGDREEPTRHLAESLGLDRYFAEVLPQDKSAYVEKLQAEGRRVCFVGDGVNDAIALKKADVSISLRGASAIATDTAQVILLREDLGRIPELLDISRILHNNVRRSWHMIVLPNVLCVLGVFTAGFTVFHSVITNNVAALAALGNGMLPLQKAARLRTEKDLISDTLILRAKLSALAAKNQTNNLNIKL